MILVSLTDLRVGDFVTPPMGPAVASRVTAVHAEPEVVLAATIGKTTIALPWEAAKLLAVQIRDRRRSDAHVGGGRRADHAPWCEVHEPGGQCASQVFHVEGVSAWLTRDTPRSEPRVVLDGVATDLSEGDAAYLADAIAAMVKAMTKARDDGEEESADPPPPRIITPIPPLPEPEPGSGPAD